MATIKSEDGTVINFETLGNAPNRPVLLLLPGMLGSIGSQWNNYARVLANEFRVVMMDLRGHGRSGNQAANLDVQQMTGDIVALLDHLNVSIVHVTGYSLGGYLGLMLALHQPRRVQTLMMHATKFYWTEESVKQMHDQLDPDTMAQKVPTYADQLVKAHGGRHWRELVRQAADLVNDLRQNGLTEKMAARAQCPVLISVGDRDEMVPLREAYRLSQVLPNAGLLTLPNVRHPFHTIRPIPMVPAMQHFHKTGGK